MVSPITTATLQAAALSSASNICAQLIEARQHQRPLSLDGGQLLRFVVMTLITTPPNYFWQQFLERKFPAYPSAQQANGYISVALQEIENGRPVDHESSQSSDHGHPQSKFSWRNTVTKWFIDCITMGAIGNTVAFLLIMGVLKGHSITSIWRSILDETIVIIVAGYKMWPIASIISFSLIPVHRRVLFLSFVGLLWGIYMSLVAARV